MERARMGEEDGRVDGNETRLAIIPTSSLSQVLQKRETEGKDEQWQVYYDETSYDRPVPWWFNSVTGESTWECPIPVASSGGFDPQPEHLVAVGATLEEGGWGEPQEAYNSALAVATVGVTTEQGISLWVSHWSEEFQAYYYVNETTRESSWEPPPAIEPTVATSSAENNSREASTGEIEQQNLAGTPLTACTEGNNAQVSYSGGNEDGENVTEGGAGAVALVEEDLEQELAVRPRQSVDSSSGYPYFVNERGNRVFCVQKRHA